MHPARNRLMSLLALNQTKPKRYECVLNAAEDEATVYLYDVIDSFYGVSAIQFAKDLNAIKSPTIHLRINSPGGDVFEGRAIANTIAQHPSKVIAHVDGLAASAASSIALAANEVEMSPGSFFMIHQAWTMAYGNANDLKATAGVLEKIDAALVEDYAKQTGNTPEQIVQWMADETWMSAEEAVAQGFADRVTEAGSVSNAWDLSAFNRAPEPLKPQEPVQIENNADADHDDRLRKFRLIELAA